MVCGPAYCNSLIQYGYSVKNEFKSVQQMSFGDGDDGPVGHLGVGWGLWRC